MKQFQYTRAASQQVALEAIGRPGTKIIAGGTNLVDHMKHGLIAPDKLVDITHLPLKTIAPTKSGLHIGTLRARNSVVSENALVLQKQPFG